MGSSSEYAHKEALAKSYHSYKKQIEALGETSEDLKLKLIEQAIEVIGYNTSDTLDKKHGVRAPSHAMLDRILQAVNPGASR